MRDYLKAKAPKGYMSDIHRLLLLIIFMVVLNA